MRRAPSFGDVLAAVATRDPATIATAVADAQELLTEIETAPSKVAVTVTRSTA